MNQSNHNSESPRIILNPYPNLYPAFPQYTGSSPVALYLLPETESNRDVVASCLCVWPLQQVHKPCQGWDLQFDIISEHST